MSLRCSSGVLLLLLIACAPVTAAAQGVELEFRDGHVTLRAQNVPVRTILQEWARLGGTQMVNADRVPGAPVTLELTDVPERQALDILLRNAAGYMIGSRATGEGRSSFDRVLILPTSSAPFNPPPPAGFVPPPPPPPLPDFDDFTDDIDPSLQQFRTPRDVMPPPPYQPDPDGAVPVRPATPQPGFPGTMPGAVRPGEIIPVPQPQADPDP